MSTVILLQGYYGMEQAPDYKKRVHHNLLAATSFKKNRAKDGGVSLDTILQGFKVIMIKQL